MVLHVPTIKDMFGLRSVDVDGMAEPADYTGFTFGTYLSGSTLHISGALAPHQVLSILPSTSTSDHRGTWRNAAYSQCLRSRLHAADCLALVQANRAINLPEVTAMVPRVSLPGAPLSGAPLLRAGLSSTASHLCLWHQGVLCTLSASVCLS